MTTDSNLTQNTKFKIGWWILVISAILMALQHFSLMFFIPDEFVLFAGWTGFNLYVVAVLYIPFRNGEKWAWNATWIFPVFTASPASGDPTIGPYYAGIAVLCVVGLLLTKSVFD